MYVHICHVHVQFCYLRASLNVSWKLHFTADKENWLESYVPLIINMALMIDMAFFRLRAPIIRPNLPTYVYEWRYRLKFGFCFVPFADLQVTKLKS
jgi:hypothetical protein